MSAQQLARPRAPRAGPARRRVHGEAIRIARAEEGLHAVLEAWPALTKLSASGGACVWSCPSQGPRPPSRRGCGPERWGSSQGKRAGSVATGGRTRLRSPVTKGPAHRGRPMRPAPPCRHGRPCTSSLFHLAHWRGTSVALVQQAHDRRRLYRCWLRPRHEATP